MDSAPEVTEVQDRGPAAYIAEFFGTLLLVFFITAVVSLYVTFRQVNPDPFIDFSVIGLVHAFLLFGAGPDARVVSGAHFNPAVTVVMTALRQIKPPDALVYLVAQFAGGVAGALLTKVLLEDEGRAVDYGVTPCRAASTRRSSRHGRRGDRHLLPRLVDPRRGRGPAVTTGPWAALVIGATLGMLVMVLAPLTAAGLNPARSFGPALVSGEFNGAVSISRRLRRGTRDRRPPRSGGLPLPRHCARTGSRRRGAGRLADHATKATMAPRRGSR